MFVLEQIGAVRDLVVNVFFNGGGGTPPSGTSGLISAGSCWFSRCVSLKILKEERVGVGVTCEELGQSNVEGFGHLPTSHHPPCPSFVSA